MKALIAIALVATAAPAFAASAAGDNGASTPRERRFCTRVELRGASHMSYRRVCKTAAEWQAQFGPDWRQELAGVRTVEEGMQQVDMLDHGFVPRDGRDDGGPDRHGPRPAPN